MPYQHIAALSFERSHKVLERLARRPKGILPQLKLKPRRLSKMLALFGVGFLLPNAEEHLSKVYPHAWTQKILPDKIYIYLKRLSEATKVYTVLQWLLFASPCVEPRSI